MALIGAGVRAVLGMALILGPFCGVLITPQVTAGATTTNVLTASTPWSQAPSPNSSTAANDLLWVSCTSPSFCVAVGVSDVGTPTGHFKTLVETYNGSTWSIMQSPNPSTSARLVGVSCTSASFCVAVGGFFYRGTNSNEPFFETYNGSTWSISTSPILYPTRANTSSTMQGVSCTSASFCVAVGSTLVPTQEFETLVETYNGSTWSITPSPNPSTLTSYLGGVDCTAADHCTAVGSADYPTTPRSFETLVETYNGSTWSITPSPNLLTDDKLDGVSCIDANSCTAMGWHLTTGSTQNLIENYNGSTWSITQSVASPFGNTGQNAISCISADFCMAVGTYSVANKTLVETYNGSTWSVTPSPNPSTSQDVLLGVSCTTTDFCVAVGSYNSAGGVPRTLILLYAPDTDLSIGPAPANVTVPATGSTGAVVNFSTPGATDEGESASVSCSTASGSMFPIGTTTVTCTATGSDDTPSSASTSFTVTVFSNPPSVGRITVPIAPGGVNSTVAGSAPYTDTGNVTALTATWNWGDGTTSTGTFTGSSTSGIVGGTHAYSSPGVYTVSVTVTNGVGQSASSTATSFVVVYDPTGGFVTGGGWITSPTGAYPATPALIGKANFGFVSKYQQGATVPTGSTEFQFHAAGFDFSSTTYQWLVTAGNKAQYKGTGTVNGALGYGFLVTACDATGSSCQGATTDTFRVKVWNVATGATVYDNAPGTTTLTSNTEAIGGGNIVVHK